MGVPGTAWWRSGYAADCKSVYPGSSPGQASKLSCRYTPIGAASPRFTGYAVIVAIQVGAIAGLASPDVGSACCARRGTARKSPCGRGLTSFGLRERPLAGFDWRACGSVAVTMTLTGRAFPVAALTIGSARMGRRQDHRHQKGNHSALPSVRSGLEPGRCTDRVTPAARSSPESLTDIRAVERTNEATSSATGARSLLPYREIISRGPSPLTPAYPCHLTRP